MIVLRGLVRAVAAVLEGFSTLIGVGRGSARRALFDRWDDAIRRQAFPARAEQARRPGDGGSWGWAPEPAPSGGDAGRRFSRRRRG